MNASPSHRGTPITGLICAPFTALDAKGDLNLAIVPDYAGCLKENGIIGAFVNGSSGEGLLLTLEDSERRNRYLNARATFTTLLAHKLIPIVNENDTVATAEVSA